MQIKWYAIVFMVQQKLVNEHVRRLYRKRKRRLRK